MAVMRMVQPSFDQIIHMVAVRHGGMPAIRSVDMLRRVTGCAMSTGVRMVFVHGNHVLFKVIAFDMVQMALA